MKGELKNDFSWSKSRDDVFRTCLRRYYYNYYAFWNGWSQDAPEATRTIYVLKQLRSRQMWAGEKVHKAIERNLRGLRQAHTVRPLKTVIDDVLAEMRSDFRSSRDRLYWTRPKSTALFEHEYGLDIPDEEWRATADSVEQCLRNFYRSTFLSELEALRTDQWLETEEFSSFSMDDIKVWAVMDCSYRTPESITIIDWKTGRSEVGASLTQLACYALYAIDTWGGMPEDIRVIEYNLFLDASHEYAMDQNTLDNTVRYILASAADMRSFLADPAGNVAGPEERFETTENDEECRWCNYRSICPKTA